MNIVNFSFVAIIATPLGQLLVLFALESQYVCDTWENKTNYFPREHISISYIPSVLGIRRNITRNNDITMLNENYA